ncbi:hypothetical protein FACS1894120_0050 [Clostridia bacterium]|nr:hypothetical protein FACS1894120_0050 [Clostridia bacterium]
MPHASIKCLAGSSDAQKKACAEAVAKVMSEKLGKPSRYVSVTVEEFSHDEWVEIYNKEIGGNKSNLLVEPGYTNPATFS